MHLMPNMTLLAASLQYGVVSRSYPLIGKILRGYLDASGTLNGLGIGNPNAEFSPHVSSVALASDGGTAKVLWGFRNGAGTFPTIQAGIDFMTHRIAEHPYYKGKTLPQKLLTYNPRPAYPGEIMKIMQQIEALKMDVKSLGK